MPTPLWSPTPEAVRAARITRFGDQLGIHDYPSLHHFSVTQKETFWSTVWDFSGVQGEKGDVILAHPDQMPGALWFPDASINFAENLLRRRDSHPALVSLLENGDRRALSYGDLFAQAMGFGHWLRANGIGPGDRVAAFMPNIAETVVAMLGTASIGAVFSSCSPDFGEAGVLDRFGQIKPRVLVCADGYRYGGRQIDVTSRIEAVVAGVPSIEQVVITGVLSAKPRLQARIPVTLQQDITPRTEPGFARLPFNHPLFILYSSGTTGVPKCIVHGAGGTLLQHLKEHQLHVDLGPDDVLFYYTTCGWMMWNWLVAGLASGATLILYDGAAFYPRPRSLIDMAEREQVTVFGTSARYLVGLERARVRPRETHHLPRLRSILSTGSPLSPESFEYVYRDLKADLCLSSISGGTDILSCFALGNPALPVYAGELQCRGLGMDVAIYDEAGNPVVQQKGELVCRSPFPSMPLGFWADDNHERYRAAYFDRFPGVWAHGDYGELTATGGLVIHGRSDAVLNPGGVRIGTAEIYRQLETIAEIIDAVCVPQTWRGDVRVILFVVLRENMELDDGLIRRIGDTIRVHTTPRHVPAKVIQVSDVPRTLSGKIAEIAVREAIHGRPVANVDALANPSALDQYRDLPALTRN